MYKCKYFKIYELVDRKTFESNPEWKLWLAFDERLLNLMDFLREELNVPITINNWKWNGDREWSGLRSPGSPYYSQFSQHSFGRAIDFVCSIPAPEVRKKIKKLVDEGKISHITNTVTLEDKKNGVPISWVHIDLRNNDSGYNSFDV